jgi:hypothetical protein
MKHLRSPSIALLSACDRLFDRLFDRPSIAFDHPYFYPPITLGGSKPRFRPWAAERGSARRESEEAKLRPSRSFSGDSPMTVSLSLTADGTQQHNIAIMELLPASRLSRSRSARSIATMVGDHRHHHHRGIHHRDCRGDRSRSRGRHRRRWSPSQSGHDRIRSAAKDLAEVVYVWLGSFCHPGWATGSARRLHRFT